MTTCSFQWTWLSIYDLKTMRTYEKLHSSFTTQSSVFLLSYFTSYPPWSALLSYLWPLKDINEYRQLPASGETKPLGLIKHFQSWKSLSVFIRHSAPLEPEVCWSSAISWNSLFQETLLFKSDTRNVTWNIHLAVNCKITYHGSTLKFFVGWKAVSDQFLLRTMISFSIIMYVHY